jgi:hypothetical protein
MELNSCDKCKVEINTLDLVWITAEDFQPFEGEVLNAQAYNKYDALCESCYRSELEGNGSKT